MNSKRRALFATILATSSALPAQAGCLDWLCGSRSTTTPVAVGFVPQTTISPLGPPVAVGQPVLTAPYSAGFAPQATGFNPYQAGFAPGFAGLHPTVAAQAPAYSAGFALFGTAIPLDNPSVLTGRPVLQTSAMQPSTMPFAGSTFGSVALPPAAMTPPPQPSGFGNWIGKTFGNDYQTSSFGAPTTSYRPVTQIDPATGAMVTVQQPCTSMTQQVQRSPYTSLQPATAPPTAVPYYGEPTCGSEPPRYAPPSNDGAPSPYAPQTGYSPIGAYAQPSGVSQATAIAPSFGYGAPNYASPIPSTSPYAGAMPYQPQMTQPQTTQPLSGYPGSTPSDMAPLAAPQLDAMRPSWQIITPPPTTYAPSSTFNAPSTPLPSVPPSAYSPTTYPSSNYPSSNYPSSNYPSADSTLEAPPLPVTSVWPERREVRSGENLAGANSLVKSVDVKYSDIPPIPATSDYRAPAWSEIYSLQNATPVDTGRDRFGDRIPTSVSVGEPRSATVETSWRYASSPAAQDAPSLNALPPLPPVAASPSAPKRDDSGWFVIEPR